MSRSSVTHSPERKERRKQTAKRRQMLRAKGLLPKLQCRCPKRNGDPCPQGRAILEIDGKFYRAQTCYAHLPTKVRERAGVKSITEASEGKRGRKPVPSPTQVLQAQVESEIAEWLAPLREALQATKPIVVGTGRFSKVKMVPDHRARMQAVNEVFDRVYGKATQKSEISGAGGGPVEVEVPLNRDRELEVAKILSETGAIPQADRDTIAAVAAQAGRQN